MSPAELAAWDRLAAAAHEYAVARAMLNVEAMEAAKSLENFAHAWIAADAALALDEAEEVATHPDLAELNVKLDGFYGD